jgi:hypothetical protein
MVINSARTNYLRAKTQTQEPATRLVTVLGRDGCENYFYSGSSTTRDLLRNNDETPTWNGCAAALFVPHRAVSTARKEKKCCHTRHSGRNRNTNGTVSTWSYVIDAVLVGNRQYRFRHEYLTLPPRPLPYFFICVSRVPKRQPGKFLLEPRFYGTSAKPWAFKWKHLYYSNASIGPTHEQCNRLPCWLSSALLPLWSSQYEFRLQISIFSNSTLVLDPHSQLA